MNRQTHGQKDGQTDSRQTDGHFDFKASAQRADALKNTGLHETLTIANAKVLYYRINNIFLITSVYY